MENISKIWYGPLPADSPYVKPFRLFYVQNGLEKNWDLLKVHDSVSIVLYNTTRNKLVFVKQFRPGMELNILIESSFLIPFLSAVYYGIIAEAGAEKQVDLERYPPSLGITTELCAGIVDKDKSLVEIAAEEVHEECGYSVPVDRLETVLTYRSGVGTSGSLQTMFYCEVTDADRATSGGGVDGEMIDVVEYSMEDAQKLVTQGAVVSSPPSFLLGVLWFLTNRAPK